MVRYENLLLSSYECFWTLVLTLKPFEVWEIWGSGNLNKCTQTLPLLEHQKMRRVSPLSWYVLVSPICHMCPPSSRVPFTSVSQGSPCNLSHAATHNTLHGTQSQRYHSPLFHSLHLSLLFLRSLFVLPLYA